MIYDLKNRFNKYHWPELGSSDQTAYQCAGPLDMFDEKKKPENPNKEYTFTPQSYASKEPKNLHHLLLSSQGEDNRSLRALYLSKSWDWLFATMTMKPREDLKSLYSMMEEMTTTSFHRTLVCLALVAASTTR